MRSRGTALNPANRYQPRHIERVELTVDDAGEPTPDSVATQVIAEPVKTIISRNQSPDIPFDRSINPYRGCEHGCIYCYARPSHAWWDFSPGLDFETRLIAKPNAVARLREAFERNGYVPSPIGLGMNTDAYQPIEKTWKITRGLLEVMLEYRHPVTLITKSALILRDLDLLSALAGQGLCHVRVSLTSLDNPLKASLEPRAAGPAARLNVIRTLSAAGIPTGVMLAPIIPFINDHELEDLLSAAHKAGAQVADWILLRLPLEVAPLFEDWLHRHFPDRAERVLNRLRDLRGGHLNDSRFGERMRGTGVYQDLLRQRFTRQCRALGLNQAPQAPLRCDLFRRPGAEQLALF